MCQGNLSRMRAAIARGGTGCYYVRAQAGGEGRVSPIFEYCDRGKAASVTAKFWALAQTRILSNNDGFAICEAIALRRCHHPPGDVTRPNAMAQT
jgi:hypothetical protein